MSVPPNNSVNNSSAVVGVNSKIQANFPVDMDAQNDMEMDNTLKFKTVSRVLHSNINGSLSSFDSRGHTAGVWKPVEGKHPDVFGPHEIGGDCTDHTAAVNALRNVELLKVEQLECKNTFCVPLGISCSVIPPNESTDWGGRYATTVLPTSANTTTQTLFEADVSDQLGRRWRDDYPEYTAQNLETHNTMEVRNHPVVFVDVGHPVIALLRNNAELLGSNIDEQQLVQDRWHTVSKQVMTACCNTLRNKVLSRVTTMDLNAFQVQLHRLNRERWNDIGLGEHVPGMTEAGMDETKVQEMHDKAVSQPCSFMARWKVTYKYPV
jgi:hypothetical protein